MPAFGTSITGTVVGAEARWLYQLLQSSPDQVVQIPALATTLCHVLGQDTLPSQCTSGV